MAAAIFFDRPVMKFWSRDSIYIEGAGVLCALNKYDTKGPGMTFDELESNKGSAANRCRRGRLLLIVTACRLTSPAVPLDIITRAGRVRRRRRALRKHQLLASNYLAITNAEREASVLWTTAVSLAPSRLCKHSQPALPARINIANARPPAHSATKFDSIDLLQNTRPSQRTSDRPPAVYSLIVACK